MAATVIVTGGSGGIGAAAADALAKAGCTVYELSRSGSDRTGVSHITCDVTDEPSVRAAVELVTAREGGVDVLLCAAGFGISGAVEFTAPGEAHDQLNVNLYGADRAVRAVLPHMRAAKRGRIILISSVAAAAPIPFQTWYSASKAAINAYALALSGEVRPFGITVRAIMPGDIATGFTSARRKNAAGDAEYSGRISRSVEKMEHDEQHGMSAEAAGRAIARAALRGKKPLAAVGFAYKFICVLLKILPARLAAYIISLLYAK